MSLLFAKAYSEIVVFHFDERRQTIMLLTLFVSCERGCKHVSMFDYTSMRTREVFPFPKNT